jgi:alpha-tubulin suppressor-like RCC1 family protein
MVTGSEALASGELIPRIACGYYHSLALTLDGSVYSFGRNDYGQLGIGNNEASRVPLRIEALSTLAIKDVTSGCYHSIALTRTGSVCVGCCLLMMLLICC